MCLPMSPLPYMLHESAHHMTVQQHSKIEDRELTNTSIASSSPGESFWD
jgi:hypothetical protein